MKQPVFPTQSVPWLLNKEKLNPWKMSSRNCVAVILLFALGSCGKKSGDDSAPPSNFSSTGIKLNGQSATSSNYNIGVSPEIAFFFSSAIDKSTVNSAFSFKDKGGVAVAYAVSYENNDKTVVLRPSTNLKYLSSYTASVATSLQSTDGGHLIGTRLSILLPLLTRRENFQLFRRMHC